MQLNRCKTLFFSLVVMCGLGQSLCSLFNFNFAAKIFRATAASPLPYVFNTIKGHEYWSAKYSIEVCCNINGKGLSIFELDSRYFSKLSGPHKIKLNAVLPIIFSGLMPKHILEEPLKNQLCEKGGRLNTLFDLNQSIQSFTVLTLGRGTDFSSRIPVTCL